MKLARIPRRFFDDHRERDLPTPEVVKSTSMHYWIDLEDPAVPELLSDAEFYRDEMVSGHAEINVFGLRRSADATYNAIKAAQ
jgi:LPS sulfotransferase NodH